MLCSRSVATVILTRNDTGDGDEQQEDSQVSSSSRSKLNLEEVWNFINESHTKNVSMEALAKIRSEDVHGGVKVGTVLFWARKFMSMYHKRCQLSFLQENRVVIATDASTHGCRDVLVSLFFSPMSNVAGCAVSQSVGLSKVLAPNEIPLCQEAEVRAAKREEERLSSYKLLQALSHQLLLQTQLLTLMSLEPSPQLGLLPLKPGDSREVSNENGQVTVTIRRAGSEFEEGVRCDLTHVRNVPIVTCLMDQGPTGLAAASFMRHHNYLIHFAWDKIHRLIRDLKLSESSVPGLSQTMLMSSYVMGINYKPFGRGAFFEEKKEALSAFMNTNSADT